MALQAVSLLALALAGIALLVAGEDLFSLTGASQHVAVEPAVAVVALSRHHALASLGALRAQPSSEHATELYARPQLLHADAMLRAKRPRRAVEAALEVRCTSRYVEFEQRLLRLAFREHRSGDSCLP